MIIARPTVAEERWLALAARHAALRAAAERTGHGGNWKTTSALGRVLGFLLGLLATSLLGGTLALFPSPLLIGGLLLVIAAEWLVATRRVYRSGIEEAIYLCGATGIVVQLLLWSHGNNIGLGIALIASAVLLVGWRLLNPIFTTLAMAGYSLAIALSGDNLFRGSDHALAAAIFCGVVAVLALLAGGRIWRRPAHDDMCDGLIVVMPLLCFGWFTAFGWREGRAVALGFAAAGRADPCRALVARCAAARACAVDCRAGRCGLQRLCAERTAGLAHALAAHRRRCGGAGGGLRAGAAPAASQRGYHFAGAGR